MAPIQLAIRLLIPAGSRLLELAEIRDGVDAFDSAALYYPWRHGDPRVDALASDLQQIVERGEKLGPQPFADLRAHHREGLGERRLRSSTQSATPQGGAADPAPG